MNKREAGRVVADLSSCINHGEAALVDVPKILHRILAEEAWREFEPLVGEVVTHATWQSFVETPPTKGLGSDVATVDRLAGNDPDVLPMLKEAKDKGKGGRPRKAETCSESLQVRRNDVGENDAARLAREHPDLVDAIRRRELSLNAAATRAGYRRRRVPVRVDSAESAARTLRRAMPPDVVTELAYLLLTPSDPESDSDSGSDPDRLLRT